MYLWRGDNHVDIHKTSCDMEIILRFVAYYLFLSNKTILLLCSIKPSWLDNGD